MFGRKRGEPPTPKNAPVAEFSDPAVKYTLQGEWMTLALSKFEVSFSTRQEARYLDDPKAYGLVHFDFGRERLLRCALTLNREPDEPSYDRVGFAYFNRFLSKDDPHVLLEVVLADPRGKIESALQKTFEAAALSGNRFVHIAFRREKLDVDAVLADLQDRGNGRHPLTEISLRRQLTLPKAPAWSWLWSGDH